MAKMSVNEAFSTDVDKIRAALGNNAEARQLLWNLSEGAEGVLGAIEHVHCCLETSRAEVERLREELAGVKLERDVANSAADTVGDVACRFKLALRNLCRSAPEAIRDAPSTRTEEFERCLGEAECLMSALELRDGRPSRQKANTELEEMADAFRLALQNLCSAASDVLSDVPGARDELKARLDEAGRVLWGV